MSAPVVRRLPPVADVARALREAWARQEQQPPDPPVTVPLPRIQVNPQPQIPRVRVQTPRIALPKPKAEVKPPPVDRVENFKQTSLAPDAERLMFQALYVQNHKTKSQYVKRHKELVDENLALKQKIRQISESLQCPITCEVFVDPVMLRDGHTYERAAIEAWFANGNNNSPITREAIRRPRFPTNFAVKSVLEALQ